MTVPLLALALAFLISFLVENEAAVAIQRDDPRNDHVFYFGHPKDNSNCCVIPACDDIGHCYETLSCGYVCRHGRYRPANNFGFTPGYGLKEYYMKKDCRFGECRTYKFLCTHCPNPKEDYFSIYTVREDCKRCYYYM